MFGRAWPLDPGPRAPTPHTSVTFLFPAFSLLLISSLKARYHETSKAKMTQSSQLKCIRVFQGPLPHCREHGILIPEPSRDGEAHPHNTGTKVYPTKKSQMSFPRGQEWFSRDSPAWLPWSPRSGEDSMGWCGLGVGARWKMQSWGQSRCQALSTLRASPGTVPALPQTSVFTHSHRACWRCDRPISQKRPRELPPSHS